MTRALPFTQVSLRCALAAARKEGFRAVRVLPDGSIIIEGREAPAATDKVTKLDRELEEFEALHDAKLQNYEAPNDAD
jgi:hypothetical protein